MASILCCGEQRCKSYYVIPDAGEIEKKVSYLPECPVCGHTVLYIEKVVPAVKEAVIEKKDPRTGQIVQEKETLFYNKVNYIRKTNESARKLFEKIQPSIIHKDYKNSNSLPASNFYLYCMEYGIKKKCYSNLSTLKLGLIKPEEDMFKNKISIPSSIRNRDRLIPQSA